MKDNQCLKMIANPYLLRKNEKNNNKYKNKRLCIVENQSLLYKYIENQYQNEFIPPTLFYKIIDIINENINDYIIYNSLDEIIKQIEIKFDYLTLN